MKVKSAYELVLEGSQILQNVLGQSFWAGYIENISNIVDNYRFRESDGKLDNLTKKHLNEIYEKLKNLNLVAEEWRKTSQMVLLKGSLSDPLPASNQLTPDSLGFLFVYLIEQLEENKKELTLFDISIGMGNLLLTIMTNLALVHKQVRGFGVDIGGTELKIAAVDADLTDSNLRLYHQDGIQALLQIEFVDFVISDLPIGYYPDDKRAKQFIVYSENTHTYIQHLLLEQSVKYLKEGGFGLFLLPSNLLITEQTPFFKRLLGKNIYLQAVLSLPKNIFNNQQVHKSVFIFQKNGKNVEQREVFVAHLNSLIDVEAIKNFFAQFSKWCKA